MKSKITTVQETKYGLYVWLTADGRVVMDDEQNYMCIASEEGNLNAISKLRDAARAFGVEEGGKPLFLPGRRKIDDEEYQRQITRATLGLVPDEYDAPALRDELRFRGGK
jgi:hypothetical protein